MAFCNENILRINTSMDVIEQKSTTIINEVVQKHFDEESVKMFNKQISAIRESIVSSESVEKLFDKLLELCRGCDSVQLKALKINCKQQAELDPNAIDRIIDMMSYVVDLRKKPSTARYQEVIKKGSAEKMEQDYLLALTFFCGYLRNHYEKFTFNTYRKKNNLSLNNCLTIFLLPNSFNVSLKITLGKKEGKLL